MNRLQNFLDTPQLTTGMAALAADDNLTLIAANNAFYALLGENTKTREKSLLPFLPPEDAKTFRQRLEEHASFFDWEGSLCARDGKPFHVHLSVARLDEVLHENTHPVYLVSYALAATSGSALDLPNFDYIKYLLIADISDALPFEYDFTSDTIVYTPKYREVFGQDPVIRNFCARLREGEPIDQVSTGFRETFLSLDSEESVASEECVPEQFLLTQTGTSRWFALYRTTLYDAERMPVKSVGILRDIDVQKREHLRLLDKSRSDAMTGLYNKATTEEEIRIALREVKPDGVGILFMIDIDNFKGVNDSMGHLAGDSIIMETARQLKKIFRQSDIIGRVGGDEFHVYMRAVHELYSIRERAQRLCSSIHDLFTSRNLSEKISVSVGIAIAERPVPYEELFHKADLALYQAKGNGKNRYEIFGQYTETEGNGQELAYPAASNTLRNNIMVDIVDILFHMNDMRKGIDNALEFMGNALHVDKLLIIEYSFDRKTFSITHEWCSAPKWSTQNACQNIPIEKLKLATPLNSNGVYYCSDFSALNPEEKFFLYDKSISSLLQCDISRDNNVVGHICFEERGKRRIWTQQEVDALILLSKILGEYIRQQQSSYLLQHNHADTRNILNNLPSTAVYVIDNDHRLAYFNDTVAKAYPHAQIGMHCFEVFWNRTEICPFCPVVSHGNLVSHTTLLEHSPFPGLSEVAMSKILWENRPAHVLLISERLHSPEEREAKAKRDSLARALCSSYHYVIDVDLGDGSCQLLVENSRNKQTVPKATEYTQYSEGFIQRIAPPYRETFLNYFSLKNLRDTFSVDGEPREIHFEYQTIEPDGLRWRSRIAFSYTQDDGSRHVLLCIRDIEEQKQAEGVRKQQEERVGIALQKSYAKIYQIDLPANRLTCLFCNTELLAPIDVTGQFDEDIETVMENRIHPEDRGAFLSFFNAGHILKGLSKGTELSVEYRKLALDGMYHWMLAIVVPVPTGTFGEAMLLVQDVNERKKEENSYLLALQSNYTEIFRLDLIESRISPIYYDKVQYPIVASSMDIKAFINERGENHVHPDNIIAFKAFYDAERIAKQLWIGKTSQIEYRKRTSEESPYRWINAIIRPIPGNCQQALMLLRDITELRDEEAAFYKVLQSSYTKIYAVTLDTDSVRILHHDQNDTLIMPDLSLRYWEDTKQIAHYSIHPEDRQLFLKHYTPENIRAKLASGQRLVAEYRVLSLSGSYHWISSLLLPMPGAPGRILILCQDINERKETEDLAARLQRRQSAVFRQSGDCIIEVNLRTWQYTRDVSTTQLPALDIKGDYRLFLSQILEYIHPDDLQKVTSITDPNFLLESCKKNPRTFTAQYRLINNEELWLENRVFFLQDNEDMTAFFLIRDISEQKRLEKERDIEEECFNLALRDTYTEIYEINLSQNTPHLLYGNKNVMIPLDEDKTKDINAVALRLVHPADRMPFLAKFSGENLRRQFADGQREISIEYRRLGIDGGWHWTTSSAVPLCTHGACRNDLAMLLVRDISDQKEEELRRRISEQYDHALRNIYDELYELNVSQNSYRIIYQADGHYTSPKEVCTLLEALTFIAEDLIYPEDKAKFLNFFNIENIRSLFTKGREFLIGEFRKLRQDGTYHWASLTLFPVSQESGSDELYLIFIMDIEEKKQAEEIAQQNMILERQRLDDERYRTIVEQTDTLVFEWNKETDFRYISPKIMERFAGEYNQRDLIRIWNDDDVIHHDDKPLIATFLEEIRTSSHTEMTARFRKRSGDYIWCKVALSCLRDEHGEPKRYIGTLNDVDKATQSVLDLKYRAEFDLLTDAYNMHTFYAQTEKLLHAHPERRYSIIRMDIDRFKVINDIYGLKEGDKLLVYIANMLRDMLTDECLFGRLGGDVFCMCVDAPRDQVIALIKKMAAQLANYPLPYKIVPSFGICEVDSIHTPINILCDWANLAIKAIKGNYLKLYAYYDGKLRDKILEEKNIENQMHEALLQRQFALYLQPKVHIPTSRIIGSEGLVRWIHPTEGLMPPDRFIPLFEKNGFILRLDEYIWEQACITLRRWIDQGLTPTPISVNMSRLHIHDPHLRDKLLDLVRRYNIPPRLLELEVTESALLENENSLFESMQRLQADGFLFSMDDFGSGYSSLNMLKSMPVDVIKIDRGFLNEVAGTERGKTVIRFSIALAKEMDIKVIAEGVESEKQAAFLLQAGCAYAQGYFYSRPLPIADFETLAFGKAVPFAVAPSIKALSELLEKD